MTAIKICGITNFTDAEVAVRAGADLLGFILYPKSPRYIEPEQVAVILARLRNELEFSLPQFVGVFVNAVPMEIQQVLAGTGLDLAQLHGDETEGDLAALDGRAFKALRPTGLDEAVKLAVRYFTARRAAPRLLIDAFEPTAYGGTGQRADWRAAAAVARNYDGLLLAGGLSPENVAEAIRIVRPWGVDVSSGVELSPGRKDHARVRSLIAAVRATSD